MAQQLAPAANSPPVRALPAPEPPLVEADVIGIGVDAPGRLTVPVMISTGRGTFGPYPFTVDTGAERTVISRELATLLRLERGPNVRVLAITGPAGTGTAIIPSLQVSSVGGLAIEAPIFEGKDLGAPGLLGIDSLRSRAVSINFNTQQMSVQYRPRRRALDEAGPGEIIVRAKSLLGQLVVADAFYHGQRVRVVLDTGTSVSIGNLAFQRLIRKKGHDTAPISITSVSGATLMANFTQIGRFSIGGAIFSNLPVAFADAAPFKRLGLASKPGLLLGMDALRQFRRVDIDFANCEVRLSLPAPAGPDSR